ncbi:MAG TPA: carbamoyl-phosphate synthase large subunit [Fimbriimonadaceae bacterium]|nr:carbamoyl-phosphate synthase large subunit [Fimbriimonadaceae bacterium]
MQPTVLVLGSGPIRIGQGIEFDYSCVHCVWALKGIGYRAIIINNNPETVSTDFDTGDGLYFEPVTLPDVLKVVEHEQAIGVVCQFGGQTAINLAEGLERAGVQVLGTSPSAIAAAEDRDQFDILLTRLGISKPPGKAVRSLAEAIEIADQIGYPVLIRPSFVLGGRAMEIVYDAEQLRAFFGLAEAENPGQPVLVDKYLLGLEAEVDVISDGVDTLVPGIMEHIERAGVHSGDSMAVYPTVTLSREIEWRMVDIACNLARELGVKGLMNIQFVVWEDDVYVLEVNPRASRTVPYLSKVTGLPMVTIATRCMMGETLKSMGYTSGLWCTAGDFAPHAITGSDFSPLVQGGVVPSADYLTQRASQSRIFAVKAPVFSFQKLAKVEPSLGPEMKSTGEILGIDFTYEAALYKALVASGIEFKGEGLVLMTVRDEDKEAAVQIAGEIVASGFGIAATAGTAEVLRCAGIDCLEVNKIGDGEPNLLNLILDGKVSMLINTPSADRMAEAEAARIRRACIETGIPCVTSIDTASAIMHALEVFAAPEKASCLRLEEYIEAKQEANIR